MNKREYLISLGLAKSGRGRFSAEAKAVLAKAIAEGMVFDEPVVKPVAEKKVAAPKVTKAKAPKAGSYDTKAVRVWAESKGLIEKGKRGRIPTEVIAAYQSDKGTTTVTAQRVVRSKPGKVREESVAWAYARRTAKDPKHVSEPLVAVTSCGDCAKGIAYCGCADGPMAPKYLGREPMMLARPAA